MAPSQVPARASGPGRSAADPSAPFGGGVPLRSAPFLGEAAARSDQEEAAEHHRRPDPRRARTPFAPHSGSVRTAAP